MPVNPPDHASKRREAEAAGYTVRYVPDGGGFCFIDPNGTADDRPAHASAADAWDAAWEDMD